MDCKECKHADHAAGQCKQCNCGEAYIVRSKANRSYYIPTSIRGGIVRFESLISRIPPRPILD